MGHYDAAREKHEARIIEEKAKASGMSVLAYVDWKNHEDMMERGRKLYLQRRDEDELIAYFKDYYSFDQTNK
jgi:hypothetical protein